MAILTCACYGRADVLSGALGMPVVVEDSLLATIKVDFTSGTALGGAAIPEGTQYLELYADAACHWRIQLQADSAAAAVTDKGLGAGGMVSRRVLPGTADGLHGVSAIAAA